MYRGQDNEGEVFSVLRVEDSHNSNFHIVYSGVKASTWLSSIGANKNESEKRNAYLRESPLNKEIGIIIRNRAKSANALIGRKYCDLELQNINKSEFLKGTSIIQNKDTSNKVICLRKDVNTSSYVERAMSCRDYRGIHDANYNAQLNGTEYQDFTSASFSNPGGARSKSCGANRSPHVSGNGVSVRSSLLPQTRSPQCKSTGYMNILKSIEGTNESEDDTKIMPALKVTSLLPGLSKEEITTSTQKVDDFSKKSCRTSELKKSCCLNLESRSTKSANRVKWAIPIETEKPHKSNEIKEKKVKRYKKSNKAKWKPLLYCEELSQDGYGSRCSCRECFSACLTYHEDTQTNKNVKKKTDMAKNKRIPPKQRIVSKTRDMPIPR